MSHIARMNDILTDDLVAFVTIATTEIVVIDATSNLVASYALVMGQMIDGEFSVVIEEFFDDRNTALREFTVLLNSEAGIDLESEV
jgi:hypothetical protein